MAELIGAPAAVGRRGGTGVAGGWWDHRALNAIAPLQPLLETRGDRSLPIFDGFLRAGRGSRRMVFCVGA
jgi:hypothetical protein